MLGVDEFRGENRGLVAAEVELTAANQEVTDDPGYFSSGLVVQPYVTW